MCTYFEATLFVLKFDCLLLFFSYYYYFLIYIVYIYIGKYCDCEKTDLEIYRFSAPPGLNYEEVVLGMQSVCMLFTGA
jgi:hypothetical protein